MVLRRSSTISQDRFGKLLSGKNSFIGKNVKAELKSAGLEKYLHKDELSKRDVLKVTRHLQKQGLLGSATSPDRMWRDAARNELQDTEAATAERVKKISRAEIKAELAEEAQREAKQRFSSRSKSSFLRNLYQRQQENGTKKTTNKPAVQRPATSIHQVVKKNKEEEEKQSKPQNLPDLPIG